MKLVLFEQFGKDLPDYVYENAFDREKINKLLSEHRPLLAGSQVEIPSLGDVVVILYLGIPCHLGLYIGDGMILHIERGTHSIVQCADDVRLSRRIEGYYHVD